MAMQVTPGGCVALQRSCNFVIKCSPRESRYWQDDVLGYTAQLGRIEGALSRKMNRALVCETIAQLY